MDRADEQVLVVPTEVFHRAGIFQGFCPDVERYLPSLLDPAHLRYLPRGQAENDPSFKQLIPYAVFRCGDQVFHYVRGSGGSEVRLRALRSLGVGGHICAEDGIHPREAYRAGLYREIAEEVYLESAYRERSLGLINDDSTGVGQVHLGIVHLFDLDEPRVRQREAVLTQGGFTPLSALRALRQEFESWSQLLLDGPLS